MKLQNQLLMDLRKHFRLNIYEVKIWTALLSRGLASAGELADISGVPRSRCYDVLESLEKKGFVMMQIGNLIKYFAIKPEFILEIVKKDIMEEAKQSEEQVDGIKETDEFRELELLYKTNIQHIDISTISKSIVGRTNINRLIKDMILKVKSSIVIVTTKEHLERYVKLLKSFMPNFVKRGIKAKLYAVYDESIAKKLQNVDYVNYNAQSQFVIIDKNEMIFMLSNENMVPEFEVAIWVNSPFFINAVDVLFEESLKYSPPT